MISNKNELEYQKLVMPYYKNFDETLLTIKIQHRLKYGHRSCDGSVKMSTDKCCFSHNSFVHIDTCIGGEGYHYVDGVMSGFEDSLNIQSTEQGGRQIHEKDSQPPHDLIANLVRLRTWETQWPIPFVDEFADYITIQGAPLTMQISMR